MNLMKGLDLLGYPYVVNRDLRAADRLWINYDVGALRVLGRTDARIVVGPNLFALPADIPPKVDLSECLYIQPSSWGVDLWRGLGYTAPMATWPVGIDTEEFRPRSRSQRHRSPKALVYYKRRAKGDLDVVLHALQKRRVPFSVMVYGWYTQGEYHEALAEADFMVWLGCAETQGIALQEALACDVPVLVCDATRLFQEVGNHPFERAGDHFRVTSAPYFDQRCGDRIETLADFERDLDHFVGRLAGFEPRNYVLENLGLAKQAKAFVDLWQVFGMGYDDGIKDRILRSGEWKGLSQFSTLRYRMTDKLHRMLASR
jgi:hypothetical protein